MEITQEMILDLLPLYLANEVSPETRQMMDLYLEKDVKLAKIVEQSKMTPKIVDIPEIVEMDDELKAFRKAQRKVYYEHLFTQYYVFMGLSIFFTIVWLVVVATGRANLGLPTFGVAVLFWIIFGNINYQIGERIKE